MDIEKIATSIVTLYFSKMDNISPFISEGDKEPSWDGHIYVYKSTKGKKQNYAKEDIIGRIPTQVKGDTCKATVKECSISYPVEISDLKNYKSHGVAYFVVFIEENKPETIYYDLLCPVDIARLLGGTNNKETINIDLKKLSSTRDIYTSLINFDNDRNKQTSFVSMPNFKPIDVDEVISTGVTFEAKLSVADNSFFEFIKYTTSNPIYLYSKPAIDNYPPIPVDKAMLSFKAEHKEPISVCDHIFFDCYTFQVDKRGMLFSFGYGIEVLHSYDGNHQFHYSLKGYVSQVITTLELIIELESRGQLSIGTYTISRPKFEERVVDGNKQLLKDLYDLQIIANYLGIADCMIVDFTQLDEHTRQLIKALTKVIVNKEVYKEDDWTDAQKVGGTLFNIFLPLIFCQEFEGTKIHNLLSDENPGEIRLSNDKSETNLPASFVFETYEFERIDPQYYTKVYNELTNYSGNEVLVDRVNVITLNMLLAYDSTKNRELLGLCKRMTEWLFLEKSLPYDIRLANKFQVIRRERVLEASEKKIIKQQIRKTTDNNMLAALYLLIDSKIKAREHYNKLSAKDKKIFRSFPIHTLMKKIF